MATEIKRHSLAIAWDAWLETPEGARCEDYVTLTGGPYLKNRLQSAFMAGATAGEQAERKRIRKMVKEWKLDELDIERGYNAAIDDLLTRLRSSHS